MDSIGLKLVLLTGLVTTISSATLQQIYIKDSKVPLKGGDIQIICEVSQFTNEVVRVYKTDYLPQDITTATSLTSCIPSQCIGGTTPRHTFSPSSSGITITVTNLNRAEDQKYWTCAIDTQKKCMQLTVYTITPSIQYNNPPSQNQDLVQTSVTFSCSTGCAYPAPNFVWYYNKTGGSRQTWSTTAPVTDRTDGCTDSEKIYTSTLTLPRYMQFIDKTDTTVRFQCGAISENGAKYQQFTQTSVDVRFAANIARNSDKICLSCNDIIDLKLCDSVDRCHGNQICFVEKYTLDNGHTHYSSGCKDKQTCMQHSFNGTSSCLQCCEKSFCNSQGCGGTAFPPRQKRGPLCLDCAHISEPIDCDQIALCSSGESCKVEKVKWGDSFQYHLGCESKIHCSSKSRELAHETRAVPVCRACCDGDFCNRNCTNNLPVNQQTIIG
ncbi:uncharacterized protein LOC132754295 isoform X1 [Ruditapes philippinarum]|uniref:uncharacterized protein LOC132754295 isoform X1 n=1 Tax=Ruditapes philippinarum TaxID=129788 RepID=UPI00295C2EAF|nr:uncharacterized protein LOC132754295 isoform X1 [Ruditapes philippinarum]